MGNVVIGRHINGISLNELEYASDEKGKTLEFENVEEASRFLIEAGATKEDLFYYVFEDAETGEKIR